jgi:general secretion pathway protein D
MNAIILFVLLFSFLAFDLKGQTIAEKKESFQRRDDEIDPATLKELRRVNALLEEKRFELGQFYEQARLLYQSGADSAAYAPLMEQIRYIKAEMKEIEHMWRAETASLMQNEEYALWHQPDTTLYQLVMDYGAPDYLYLIPPEVGGVRMGLNSNLPIPRESWGECLELILTQYGIGVRQLNPFLRELYIMRSDPSGIKGIVDTKEQLDFYPPLTRLCFVLTPSALDPRVDLLFLEKFSNPVSTTVEIVGSQIFITGSVETIQELLKLYSFVNSGGGRQDYQLIILTKILAKEMEAILQTAFFHEAVDEKISDGSSLKVISLEHLSQSLFLCGPTEDVKKAITLIRDVESQIEDPQEKTVFWYTTKHSDPEELASVLAKVYDLLTGSASTSPNAPKKEGGGKKEETKEKLIVPATRLEPASEKTTSHKTADGRNNFIVDPKTGVIIMVVEAEALPKIKELLKKLDVPKKMVQLEVLLFEKRVTHSNNFGINLLRIGSEAGNVLKKGAVWSATSAAGPGILEFLVSHKKGSGIPAYDFAYQFMLGQEDVQINASPSVTTMNQTPCTIAVVDEVSIDSGANEKKQRTYTRQQYGVIIKITPTINIDDTLNEEETGFVTLETDITFDTPKKNLNERPDVTRRLIKNHVRIADGQTVILGGLRRKNIQDNKESIPFLGDIPGVGKLFSHTEMQDNTTEMFVFITPKIITDPIQDAERIRKEELKKRPGDHPEFIQELVRAQEREKRRLFEGSLTLLFGRHTSSPSSAQKRAGEYDGR